ncbi:sensor histidine kinase [Halobacillus shinanisalinarum]|uniref:histidine kinase n=1 Tax=Halobacillus shinanisalinarum TaxID=2932258 RepID=A0ABY4H1P8_9BACI|nr:sensor histidine kinase [Halobacillus shinanisalinarum]UOQ92902.1 sensor histidine kinase [Halobacillus shinanisalinarum]
MKLFLRSHSALGLTVIAQGVFTWIYLWFLGFQGWEHVLYVILMQGLFIFGYLSYRWMEEYKLYNWIESEEDGTRVIPSLGNSFFSKALQQRIRAGKEAADRKIIESEAAVKERATFMNQWVHQMKTPISVIQLMIKDYDDPVFQDIRKEIFRLEEGLKTVLYSSRLSLFEKDYFIESFAIQPFMQNLIKENKRLFFQFGVYPNIVMEQEELSITSDQKWLKFVIEQLLSNAVKYSTEKSDKLDIKVEKQSDHVRLTITDHGIGIPDQDRRRVFEPYFTGVNGRKYHESTGMGLYLVKEILSKLSHEFSMETKVDEGTSFCIYFEV